METSECFFKVFIDRDFSSENLLIENELFLDNKWVEQISEKTILALFKALISHNDPAEGYLAYKLLEKSLVIAPGLFDSRNLIETFLAMVDVFCLDLISRSYFSEFFIKCIQKQIKSVEASMSDLKNIKLLLKHIQHYSVSSIVKQFILNHPNSSIWVLRETVYTLVSGQPHISYSCLDILKESLVNLSDTVLSQVFNEQLLKDLTENFEKGNQVVLQLLALKKPKLKRPVQRIISQNFEKIVKIFKETTSENKINIMKILKFLAEDQFGDLNYAISQSEILELCTGEFFAGCWNSVFHLAYYEMLECFTKAGSNYLAAAIFRVKLPDLLINASSFTCVKVNGKLIRKGLMGFVIKLGALIRDWKGSYIREKIKELLDWGDFLKFLEREEGVQAQVLGGRPRFRTLAEDEIEVLYSFDKKSPEGAAEDYFEVRYWKIPTAELEDLQIFN